LLIFPQVLTLNGHTSGIKMMQLNDDFEQLVSLSMDRSSIMHPFALFSVRQIPPHVIPFKPFVMRTNL